MPLSRVDNLRSEMDQLFNHFFRAPWEWAQTQPMGGWAPALDLYEDRDELVVKADLPGMKKEDISISLNGDVLTISGERKIERKSGAADACRAERFEGRFSRAFSLPATVKADKITAAYADGILSVTLPKAEEAKPKQIPITVK